MPSHVDKDNFTYIRVKKGGSLPLDPALCANAYIFMFMTFVYVLDVVT